MGKLKSFTYAEEKTALTKTLSKHPGNQAALGGRGASLNGAAKLNRHLVYAHSQYGGSYDPGRYCLH